MTAVEWLIDEWLHLDAELDMKLIDKNEFQTLLSIRKQNAKEMEKFQIMTAHTDGVDAGYQLAKNDDIYIESEDFLNTCNSTKYYSLLYEKGEQ
jgi:hypothetical protein